MLDFNSSRTEAERFVTLIDEAIDTAGKAETRRTYLGGSRLGEQCERRLQYEFTGAEEDEGEGFKPQTRRIFKRGHVFEDIMADWIKDAGFELKTAKPSGAQFGFSDCDGDLSGHIDGVVIEGPKGFAYPFLWENKVLGAKGWRNVAKHRVAKAYPVYATQIAVYQAYMQLAEHPALFTALNADTCEIYAEFVPFNPGTAQAAIDKGVRIITATRAGEQATKASDDPSHFVCRFCPFKQRCWS